jgi:hypothetical protein
VALALPLGLVARRDRPSPGSLSFFALIGLGFLLLEVVLIQRFVLFLGFPTYALSVVLFTLLVFTGVGSLLTGRAERAPRRTLAATLGVACVMIAVGAFGLQPLLRTLIDLLRGARRVLGGADGTRRSGARDGDADRPAPARGAPPHGGGVGLGRERHHLRARVSAGDPDRHQLRFHGDTGGARLLRGGSAARAGRRVAGPRGRAQPLGP